MSEPDENIMKWDKWKSWSTLTLEKNSQYPEIGLLTLNRPEKLNSISHAMVDNFRDCLKLLSHEFDCRVLIIRGAGRLFCAGIDLMPSGQEQFDWARFPDKVKISYQVQQEISALFLELRNIPQPVISAVHGAAAGGGMAIANASDLVFASRKTKFINAFIKIGLSGADCGSSYFLPRIMGFHRSAELLYTGRDFSAEEAHAWGYVNRIVENHEDAVPEAVKFAAEYMLTKSPLGLRMTKQALNANIDAQNAQTAIMLEDRNQTITAQSDDMHEGLLAFFEKRNPKYTSR